MTTTQTPKSAWQATKEYLAQVQQKNERNIEKTKSQSTLAVKQPVVEKNQDLFVRKQSAA